MYHEKTLRFWAGDRWPSYYVLVIVDSEFMISSSFSDHEKSSGNVGNGECRFQRLSTHCQMMRCKTECLQRQSRLGIELEHQESLSHTSRNWRLRQNSAAGSKSHWVEAASAKIQSANVPSLKILHLRRQFSSKGFWSESYRNKKLTKK